MAGGAVIKLTLRLPNAFSLLGANSARATLGFPLRLVRKLVRRYEQTNMHISLLPASALAQVLLYLPQSCPAVKALRN